MAYGAVHTGFFENAKYLAALRRDPQAVVLYVWGLTYCHEHLTDGVIPELAVRRRVELRKPLALAAVLCDVGLWELRPDGFTVHDWLDFNPSLERIKERRQLAAERQAKWRATHRDETSGRYVRNALRDASHNALRNAAFTNTDLPTNNHPGSTAGPQPVRQGVSRNGRGAGPDLSPPESALEAMRKAYPNG